MSKCVKMRSQLAIHDSIVILDVWGDSICVRLRIYTCSVGFEQKIVPLTKHSCFIYLKILINRDFGSGTFKKKKKKKKKKRLREHLFIFPLTLTAVLVSWHMNHTENQVWNEFWWISRILGRELKNAWTNLFNTESSTDSLYSEVGEKMLWPI